MKAVAYLRVSTTKQADSGVSLAAQREAINKWAQYVDADVEFFEDAGVSGRKLENRPQLKKASNAACRLKCTFIVYSLSRIARSTSDLIEIGKRFEKADVDLISLTEKIDTTSPTGRMVFRLLASLAEFERDIVGERTKAALAHKKANGLRISGRIPFGYDVHPNDFDDHGKPFKQARLVENLREQVAIERMVEMRNDGKTLREIGEALHKEGIKPKLGSAWAACSVRSIIKRATA